MRYMDRIAEIWLMESYWILAAAAFIIIALLSFFTRQYLVAVLTGAVALVSLCRLYLYEREVGDLIRQNMKERKS